MQRLLRLQPGYRVCVCAIQLAASLELVLFFGTSTEESQIGAATCHWVLSCEVDVDLCQAAASAILTLII